MTKEARVLIIEADDALRVMLFTILRHQAPLAVDTAQSMEAACEKVSGCDYALILIDMSLPGNTGEQFLRWFRDERMSESPSFIIAVRDPNDSVVIDPVVVKAVLNKPIELDTLAEVVRECAVVVPMPEDSTPCPPAESDVRTAFDRGSYMTN